MPTNADYPAELLSRMQGPIPPDDFVCNGCTNSPDTLNGIDISCACHVHDWHYAIGGDESDRFSADLRLRYNIHECIAFWEHDDEHPSGPETAGPAHLAAGIYYRRVRFWGVNFFTYVPPRRWPKRVYYMTRGWFRRWFE